MAKIPAVQVDGMDAVAVHDAVSKAVEEARNDGGPRFVEALCYRYQGHSVADPDKYRDKDTIDEWKKRDAIERVKNLLLERGVSTETIEAMDADVQREMKDIMAYAENSPAPDVSTLFDHIYAQPV